MALPLAVNTWGRPSAPVAVISSVVRSSLASAIWEATVRFQISSYRRASSGGSDSDCGRWPKSVGRIASCASWAFLTLVWYCLAPP